MHAGHSLHNGSLTVEPSTKLPEKPTSSRNLTLLSLPLELILKIVEHVVVDSSHDDPLLINEILRWKPRETRPLRPERTYKAKYRALLQPALTRTNRFFRTEGLRLFYGKNIFAESCFPYTSTATNRWLFNLSPEHKQLIPCIYSTNVFVRNTSRRTTSPSWSELCNLAFLQWNLDCVPEAPLVVWRNGRLPMAQINFNDDRTLRFEVCRPMGGHVPRNEKWLKAEDVQNMPFAAQMKLYEIAATHFFTGEKWHDIPEGNGPRW